MLRKAVIAMALAGLPVGLAGTGGAADLGTAPAIAPRSAVTVAPQWYGGGHRWHGHYDWNWGADPHHVFAHYGWKQPWVYAPRTLPYREYRPRVVMPEPVQPTIRRGTPAAWTAQWYQYCAGKYRSFDPETGLYTSYSGRRQVCE